MVTFIDRLTLSLTPLGGDDGRVERVLIIVFGLSIVDCFLGLGVILLTG